MHPNWAVCICVLKEQREKNEIDGHKQKLKPVELVLPGVSSGMKANFETTSVWEAVFDVMSAVFRSRKKKHVIAAAFQVC